MKKTQYRDDEPRTNKEQSESVYYIGGKWYSPDNAIKLCEVQTTFFSSETLYRTPNGAFFTLIDDATAGIPKATLLSDDEAHNFLDEHAAGIDKENYIAVFGEPEQG